MNRRAGLILAIAFLCGRPAHAVDLSMAPDDQRRITIGFVELAQDARYAPVRVYSGLVLKRPAHPFEGAQLGVEESEALMRVAKARFDLRRITLQPHENIGERARQALQDGVSFLIADLPPEKLRKLADAVKGRDALVFNVSAPEDALRRDLCAREVVHVTPSRAQLMDGLAQFVVSRKWRDVLVLQGPAPKDEELSKAFQRSLQKFGGRVVATQFVEAGTDPRRREKNNPALASATQRDYDVAFVADSAFDFARDLPFRMARPRPVIGSIDLEPVAWHWTWDHNGAPQVNGRFMRLAGERRMEGPDWAAWIAVKMVAQAAARAGADFKAQRDFVLHGRFDGDKGTAVSIRPWDHQVRQAILLAAPYEVVASAPVEGFLHQSDVLDTLGDDAPESPCHLDRP